MGSKIHALKSHEIHALRAVEFSMHLAGDLLEFGQGEMGYPSSLAHTGTRALLRTLSRRTLPSLRLFMLVGPASSLVPIIRVSILGRLSLVRLPADESTLTRWPSCDLIRGGAAALRAVYAARWPNRVAYQSVSVSRRRR